MRNKGSGATIASRIVSPAWRPNDNAARRRSRLIVQLTRVPTESRKGDAQRRRVIAARHAAYFPAHPSCPLQDSYASYGPIDYSRYLLARTAPHGYLSRETWASRSMFTIAAPRCYKVRDARHKKRGTMSSRDHFIIIRF